MGTSIIPVDLLNPGQVFACLGFLEAADLLCGPAEGGFVWEAETDTLARFALTAAGSKAPVAAIVSFLRQATVSACVPAGSPLRAKEPGVDTIELEAGVFPCREPDTPSALPAMLACGGSPERLVVDHWADGSSRDTLKFWAGMAGYSGAALVRDMLEQIAAWPEDVTAAAISDPFNASALQSSSLRFDLRKDYVAIGLGFTVNAHPSMAIVGYPLVEVLAAVGLSHARPLRIDKLHYRYGVIGEVVPPPFARAALGGATAPFRTRRFSMRLLWPGQEGQARAISFAEEEMSR